MNFLLLRLLLAICVAVSHYRLLTGAPDAVHALLSSTVAVEAFFVVSGWIVSASYRADPRPGPFFVRRLMRLYPLYAAVVLVQAALVALWTPDSIQRIEELLRYLVANLSFASFLQPDALGFFAHAPGVAAINPSLWTLKIEVAFYLCVPLLVAAARSRPWVTELALYAGSVAFVLVTSGVSEAVAKQLPGQLRFFVAGMVCQRLAASGALGRLGARPLALAGLAGVMLAQRYDDALALSALQPVFVASFVAAAAALTPKSFERWPDLSYGVYLIHAPLIQFALHFGVLPAGAPGLAAVLAATLAMSAFAAYAIERPALRLGRRWSARLGERASATSGGAGVRMAGGDLR